MKITEQNFVRQMELGNELQFDLNGTKIGSFAFTAFGKELLADTATIELNRTFTLSGQSSVTLTKYTSSDVNQKIYFEASMDGYAYDLMLKGTDDLGNDVEFTVRSYKAGAGRMEVSTDYEEMGEPFTIRLNTEN